MREGQRRPRAGRICRKHTPEQDRLSHGGPFLLTTTYLQTGQNSSLEFLRCLQRVCASAPHALSCLL